MGVKMTLLSDQEKKKILEEEQIRAKVERKSSGTAGVLSSVCPGLGQIYNGQLCKGALFAFIVLLGIIITSAGITFWIKGMPSRGESISFQQEEQQVEMDEQGIIMEEGSVESEGKTEEKQTSQIPALLTIVGLIAIAAGWSFAVKDAFKSARRINGTVQEKG
jgi:hypothetical protein